MENAPELSTKAFAQQIFLAMLTANPGVSLSYAKKQAVEMAFEFEDTFNIEEDERD